MKKLTTILIACIMLLSITACGGTENTPNDNRDTEKADSADKTNEDDNKNEDSDSKSGSNSNKPMKIISGDTETKQYYEFFLEGLSNPTVENLTAIVGKEPSAVIERVTYTTYTWNCEDLQAGISLDINLENEDLVEYTFNGIFLTPNYVNKVQEWCADAVFTDEMGELHNDEGESYTYEDFCELFKSDGIKSEYQYNEAGDLVLTRAAWNDINGIYFISEFDEETGLSNLRHTTLPYEIK